MLSLPKEKRLYKYKCTSQLRGSSTSGLPQTVTTAEELTRLLLGSLTAHSPPQPLAWRNSPSSLLEASTVLPVSGLSPNESLHFLMLPLRGCGGGTFSSTLDSWFTSRNKGRGRLEKERLGRILKMRGTCVSSSFSVLGNQGRALLLSVSGSYFPVPLDTATVQPPGWTRAPTPPHPPLSGFPMSSARKLSEQTRYNDPMSCAPAAVWLQLSQKLQAA